MRLELYLQVVEEIEESRRWHFYPFNGVIHVIIYKEFNKNHYDWKIVKMSTKKLIKQGASISYDQALCKIENYLDRELLVKDFI